MRVRVDEATHASSFELDWVEALKDKSDLWPGSETAGSVVVDDKVAASID